MKKTLSVRTLAASIAATVVAGLFTAGCLGATSAPAVAAGSNAITVENAKTGTTKWQLPYSGYKVANDVTKQVKGFATNSTVAAGKTISFKVTVSAATTISIDIYRLGYYGGTGGRLVKHITGVNAVKQPSCTTDTTVHMLSCANWSTTYTLTADPTWVSGVYEAVFSTPSLYQSLAPFWVTDDVRNSDLLYVSSYNTYEAYNNYPFDTTSTTTDTPPTGRSLYPFNSATGVAANKVSFDRPFTAQYGGSGAGGFTDFEPFEIQWLEKSGYDVSYTSDVQIDVTPAMLLHHKAIVFGGHSEYWTAGMYDAAEAARAAGVGLAFTTSNEIYWHIRDENNRRTIVGYKDNAPDPNPDPSQRTILWRQQGRPEQLLAGVQWPTNGLMSWGGQPYVPKNTSHWAYAGTGMTSGVAVSGEIVGYEIDSYDASVGQPPGTEYTLLAASPFTDDQTGNKFTHNSSIYKGTGGNYVWATGSMDWAWTLAPGGSSDGTKNNVRPQLQIMTKNILDAMMAAAPVASPSPSPSPSASPSASPTDSPSPSASPSPSVSASPTDSPSPSPSASPTPTPINGGFETGDFTGWTRTGTTSLVTSGQHSGTRAVLLGSTSPTNGDSKVSQSFTIPAGATTVSFWYSITCPDDVAYDWATVSLKDNTTAVTTTPLAKTCTNAAGWKQVRVPVTAGHSYTLTLVSHDENNPGDATSTTYDDVVVS